MSNVFPYAVWPAGRLEKSEAPRYETELALPKGFRHIDGPFSVPPLFPESIAGPHLKQFGKPSTGVSFESTLPLDSSLAKPLGYYQDGLSGKKYVLKQARNLSGKRRDPLDIRIPTGNPRPGEATRHEALAQRLYRFFGFHVPASQLYDGFTGRPVEEQHDFGDHLPANHAHVRAHAPYLLSEHLGDNSLSIKDLIERPEFSLDAPSWMTHPKTLQEHQARVQQFLQLKKDIARGLIMDSLMGDYDLHMNNIGVEGKQFASGERLIPWRWDVGASIGFNPYGNKKTWGYWGASSNHRDFDVLPMMIAILRHDIKRAGNSIDPKMMTYSAVFDDPESGRNLLSEIHRITQHARTHQDSIKRMFQHIPKGFFHYNIFMDRIRSLENMARTYRNPDDLIALLKNMCGPFPTMVHEIGALSPGPYRGENQPEVGIFRRIRRNLGPLFGAYRSRGEQPHW